MHSKVRVRLAGYRPTDPFKVGRGYRVDTATLIMVKPQETQ